MSKQPVQDKPARRDAVIAALAAGRSAVGIARDLGISERTVRRWAADPAVAEAVRICRTEAREAIVTRLVHAALEGVDTLQALLQDERSTVRLGAAKTLVELALDRVREAGVPDPQPGVTVDVITELLARLNGHAEPPPRGDSVAPPAGSAESGLSECGG